MHDADLSIVTNIYRSIKLLVTSNELAKEV